jgi:hypothetical protein
MRHPQLLLYDPDFEFTEVLRNLALDREPRLRWFFRARRQPESCLRFLRPGNPGVLVLRLGRQLLGRQLERELKLLERVAWQYPDVAAVVVCDVENAAMIALAWDLGARHVLPPSQPREQLPEIVTGLMKAALRSADLERGRRGDPLPEV